MSGGRGWKVGIAKATLRMAPGRPGRKQAGRRRGVDGGEDRRQTQTDPLEWAGVKQQ